MGIQIRGRSPAEHALYESIIPRLCAGESCAKISREFGIPAQTIRTWKTRAKQRNGGRLPGSTANTPELIAPEITHLPAAVSAENVREFLLSQGETAAPLLKEFGQEMAKGLKTSHDALLCALETVTRELNEHDKDVLIHDGDGESHIEQMRKAPADNAATIKSLSVLIERFAAFHCIPHGALKTEALRFAPAAVNNHLHLHSHGARGNKAVRTLPSGEMQPLDVTPANASAMSGHQASMVQAADD